jgi:hypothetical protein
MSKNGAFMRRNTKTHPGKEPAAASEERDSPTIKNLIEQLDRDLVEAQLDSSKAR